MERTEGKVKDIQTLLNFGMTFPYSVTNSAEEIVKRIPEKKYVEAMICYCYKHLETWEKVGELFNVDYKKRLKELRKEISNTTKN